MPLTVQHVSLGFETETVANHWSRYIRVYWLVRVGNLGSDPQRFPYIRVLPRPGSNSLRPHR
jgi:hypothetical protein